MIGRAPQILPLSSDPDQFTYGAAFRHLGLFCHHEQGLRQNNRAENSHQVVRRRGGKMPSQEHEPYRQSPILRSSIVAATRPLQSRT